MAESFIDLKMTARPDQITECRVNELDEFTSDRPYLEFEIATGSRQTTSMNQRDWRWKNLNKEIFTKTLDEECRKKKDEGIDPNDNSIRTILTRAC